MTNKDTDNNEQMPEFETWLRTVCFQKPTPEAYDLAKSAWTHIQENYVSKDTHKELMRKQKKYLLDLAHVEILREFDWASPAELRAIEDALNNCRSAEITEEQE